MLRDERGLAKLEWLGVVAVVMGDRRTGDGGLEGFRIITKTLLLAGNLAEDPV